jgi:hypothetical protein
MKEPCLKKEAASSMKRPKETLCNSTDISNPFLGLYFSRGDGLRRKLEYRCFLTFKHVSQQHRLPVWKFQRIVMGSRVVLVDLPKDGHRVLEHLRHPAEQPAAYAAPYRGCKGKLCSWKNANRRVGIFRCSEPARAGIEVTGSQFLANFGRT